jgi:hypothetical protein
VSQEEEIQARLSAQIEVLERQLDSWAALGFTTRPEFSRAVERKQLLQSDLEISKRRLSNALLTKEEREQKQGLRYVSQAPAPISPLRGSWRGSQERSTQMPPNPPTNFPSDLWPKTCLILADAVQKFPDRRRQMPELCEHLISDMTPLYCGAVLDGTMKADAALREDLGGMQDLLRSLLMHNDDGPRSGFGGLSNQAYQIYVEARNTEAWRMFTKAIANAQDAQGLFKTVADAEQSVESKSTNAAVGPFTHSEDYRSVTVRGDTYTLTSEQAAMIQILYEAHENGNPDLSIAYILEQLDKKSSRWQDTFKSNPKAKEALVKSGARKGTLRLNV